MDIDEFNNFFNAVYSDVPDCVCAGVTAYEGVIKNIFELTNGLLNLKSFTGVNKEGRNFKLILGINERDHTVEFEGTGYFHQDLLEYFNQIIKTDFPNESRKLFEVEGNFYDFAVVFEEPSLELQLAKEGILWRSAEWMNKQGLTNS
ncbi:MAG: hypothetical protein P8P74_01230 [Crocinitomicaceae bacterium]|nr:hypothetical protein [Crocinitomicaceae bacterium]